jgi:chromosome partitioning protein
MIVMIGGEKGGTGKTTIATNLAAYLATVGHDVLLVDSDPQCNAANWAARRQGREEPIRAVVCVQKTGDIRATLLDQAKRYSYVIVDSGGRDSHELRSGLLAADVFYTPIRASQPDLETIPTVAKLVEQTRLYNPHLQVRSVLSMASPNTFIKGEIEAAEEFLGEHASTLPVSKVVIRDRKVYRDAGIEGFGVVEMDNSTARGEITQLAEEIFG